MLVENELTASRKLEETDKGRWQEKIERLEEIVKEQKEEIGKW